MGNKKKKVKNEKIDKIEKVDNIEDEILKLDIENSEEIDQKEFEKAKQKYEERIKIPLDIKKDIYKNFKRINNTSCDGSIIYYNIYIKRSFEFYNN